MPRLVDPPARTSTRAARVVTEIFAPAVFAAVMPLIIALHSTAPAVLTGLGWAALAILFCSVIPYGIIWLGVRRGRLTDHHIGVREQRRMPLVYGMLSVLGGLFLLVLAGAPRPLIAMVVVMFAVLLVVTAINQVWKLSAHAAVAAGSVSVLIIVFGPALIPALALVALVGWSRVRLGDHLTSQVIAGALAGIVIAVPTFLLLA
ncbi:phosphatase PAP2 family protein [Micromonospora sp. NPDC000089]|uniref:phosphatase PAP2 family protein n=1 Tax=unclassified Micromonospora TaxID=2617518 RepID=UPI003693CEA9